MQMTLEKLHNILLFIVNISSFAALGLTMCFVKVTGNAVNQKEISSISPLGACVDQPVRVTGQKICLECSGRSMETLSLVSDLKG